LTGSLTQDLDAVEVAKDQIRVGGKITLPFSVESGDLSTFRLSTRLKAQGVSAHMTGNGLAIEGFDGEIPLIEDLALKPDGGISILTGPPKNIYSRTRFLDTHPFLQGDNFLSVKKLSVAGQTLGPIAGNLRINRDMFALDQLQIGYRGGRISGQVIADYQAGKPRLLFKGNLTGIRPTQSEDVLDANATLVFKPDKLDLQGRIQVIRIGKQHLLDLLDFLDPYKENVGINRARLGLKVGYPKFLRLRMQDGFLAVKIALGGVAKVVRIDEIKNIALGPFLNKYVAPYVK
jgi:translocation and assembly module TamB